MDIPDSTVFPSVPDTVPAASFEVEQVAVDGLGSRGWDTSIQ